MLIAAAMVVVSCGRDPMEAAREYADRGDEFARDGRVNAAVIEYRNAVKEAPSWVVGREKLADALVQLGRIEEAYREYTITSRIVDGQPLPQNEDQLRAAVTRAPDLAAARVALADLLLTKGETDEAEAHLLTAVEKEPANELAHRALAAIYLSDNRPKEAETHLRLATAAVPQRYRSELALADFLIEAERYGEARTVLEKGRGNSRLASGVKVRLAAIDYEEGDTESAHRALREVLEQGATAEAWALQAELQFRERKLADALASARQALELDPDMEAARNLTETIRREQLWARPS
jgi:predicted Zn-dependent protease